MSPPSGGGAVEIRLVKNAEGLLANEERRELRGGCLEEAALKSLLRECSLENAASKDAEAAA